MLRRNFLKNTFTTSAGLLVWPSLQTDRASLTKPLTLSELEKGFITPPGSARPWVFWMWMNGHITKEGITADLEAMHRMGIGGVINFNAATGIPKGPIEYASEQWSDLVVHTVVEGERLGIDITIHNSPGYSGAGGPWISPEWSMQQLVWTETLVNSAGAVDHPLPKPIAKHAYYQDAYVVAYPSLPVEKALMKDKLLRVLANGKQIDKGLITDKSTDTKIRLESSSSAARSSGSDAADYDIGGGSSTSNSSLAPSGTNSLVLEFSEPFEARAITLLRRPEIPHDLFDGPRDHPPLIHLESSMDGVTYTRIGTVRSPELRHMDTPSALSFEPVSAKFFRLLLTGPSWICDVELYNGPRLGGWPGKASYTHGDSSGATPAVPQDLLIDVSRVIDISAYMDATGQLKWNAPAGNWTILRIGHTTTGEETFAQPDGANGLQLDKFRTEALDVHFTLFLDKILDRVKPYIGKSFKGITVDSWEAGKQNWSVNFPAEFKKRQAYELVAWLPALTGRLVGSVEETERFLWDVRKTQADLLSDNFYGHFTKECHKRGLLFNAEPYGDGNFDSLQANQHLDVPMSEFWSRYIYGSDMYSKQAVSAARTFGKKVVAAEAFTAMPATSKWTDYPYSLKAEGDYFFTLGVNRLVFHTFVHQPYLTAKPAMTMGPFGMHIDRNNSWTEQAYGWIDHLKRAQFLLQQGVAVSDVCYFKGDNPQSGVPDVYSFLPAGYTGDVIGPDALHQRLKIINGSIVLPDGMQYRLCILASLDSILPSSLKRLRDLVAEGMVLLVTNKPQKAPGRSASDDQIHQLTTELYGNLDGKQVTERAFGKGKVIWGKPLMQVLNQFAIQPDFSYTAQNQDATIHFIHKLIGDTEYYYVTNHKRRPEHIVCSFRTSGKQPELWNSQTGSRLDAVIHKTEGNRVQIPLLLEPAGAVFVVFRRKASPDGYTSISRDNKPLLTASAFPLPKPAIYADVQNTFSISAWVKPDTFAHVGKSMLFHAPEGEATYGSGHAAMALSAGQNGVRLYERNRGGARVVLETNQPLEGWTYLTVVYTNAKPTIYLNGVEVAAGSVSTFVVHPGLSTPAAPEQFASYFEGNFTPPQLHTDALTAETIRQHYLQGLPVLPMPAAVHLEKGPSGQLKALFWQNGNYRISSDRTAKIAAVSDAKTTELSGEWTVNFPTGLGAPAQIVLQSLGSLHRHADFAVKHFSGTARYEKTLHLAKSDLQPGKKLFLDLGRVEVIAEVRVNGKKAGLLWKEPFLIDITGLVIAGSNKLEIDVTTLWPNRLIGDEHLPAENQYSKDRFILALPDWYVKNKPKPGQRITFTTWHNLEKTDPLLESGLLGPVQIRTAVEKIL